MRCMPTLHKVTLVPILLVSASMGFEGVVFQGMGRNAAPSLVFDVNIELFKVKGELRLPSLIEGVTACPLPLD